MFSEQQMRVFAAAYKWRDTVAREEVPPPPPPHPRDEHLPINRIA